MIFRPNLLLDKDDSDRGIFEFETFYPLLMISLACILYGLSVGINMSNFSLFLSDYSLTAKDITQILSKELLGNILIAPFILFFTSRFGHFKLIIFALIVRNLALFNFILADNFYNLEISMFIFGIGGFALYVCIFQWVNNLADNAFRATYLSIVSFAFGLGISIGPVIILLFKLTDSSLIFGLSIGFSSLMVFPIMMVKKFSPQILKQSNIRISKIISYAYIPMICAISSEYIFYSISEFLPLYILGNGFNKNYAYLLSSYYSIAGLILSIPAGILMDKYDRVKMIIIFSLLIIISIQLIPAFINNIPILMLVFIFLASSVNGVIIGGLAILGDKFRGDDFIFANSGVHALSTLGGFAGVSITGNAMSEMGDKGFIFSISSLFLVFLAMLVIEVYRRRS